MIVIIPTTSDPNQEFSVTLDGVEFVFQLQYNERADLWSINILDSAQNLILGGVCVRVNYSLLEQYADESLPAGNLYAIDQNGTGTDPGADDMGSRVVLAYEQAS